MKAGKSNFDCGVRVRIGGLKGDDAWLNGKQGELTNPFVCLPIGEVGVYLDQKVDCSQGTCNLMIGEFEIIPDN